MERDPLPDDELEEDELEEPIPSSESDSAVWSEAEEAGDEREPLEGEEDGPSEPEPSAEAEPEEAEESVPQPQAVVPEYPSPPCYVTVGQGDCILSLAKRYRRLPEHVWEAPENAELRQQRKQNVLQPGDRVFVPEIRFKEVDGATEQRHRFKARGVTCLLKLRLLRQREPRKNLSYVLTVGDRMYEGSTDGDGMLEVKIPLDAREGTLCLQDPAGDEVYPLQLGHLNPGDDTAGVQARLSNLGFTCGEVDGQAGPRTQGAIAAFQRDEGLQVTGQADEATRNKLLERHGS